MPTELSNECGFRIPANALRFHRCTLHYRVHLYIILYYHLTISDIVFDYSHPPTSPDPRNIPLHHHLYI